MKSSSASVSGTARRMVHVPAWRSLTAAVWALSLVLAACHSDTEHPRGGAGPGSAGVAVEPAAGNAAAGAPATALASESALTRDIEGGNLKGVQRLLEQGADPNAPDPVLARTPLHSAGFYGQEKIAELLLQRGANVEAKDSEGLTPLHAAVLGGSRRVASLYIARGADVNAATEAGATPLHLAAATGEYQLAKLLLRNGADVTRLDKAGRPPRDYAATNGHAQTAALLTPPVRTP